MTWASSWSFNTRSRATSLTGKGLVGDDDLLRFRMPTEMLREIEQRTREARLHGQKIGSGNRFVRLPQPPGQYIDEIAVDLGVLCHALLECIAAHEAQLAITNGNLEQYSLSAISALAERALAALVPR